MAIKKTSQLVTQTPELNSSINEDQIIKTFNGNIVLAEGVGAWEENSKELGVIDNMIPLGERNGYFISLYTTTPSFFAIPIINSPGVMILSRMNLSDTIDFVDTLNVSKSS